VYRLATSTSGQSLQLHSDGRHPSLGAVLFVAAVIVAKRCCTEVGGARLIDGGSVTAGTEHAHQGAVELVGSFDVLGQAPGELLGHEDDPSVLPAAEAAVRIDEVLESPGRQRRERLQGTEDLGDPIERGKGLRSRQAT
jgi:hypothetical protein